jgi:ankyrin repeat protein
MTKFDDPKDPGFVMVAGELRRWSKQLAQTPGPAPPSLTPSSSLAQSPPLNPNMMSDAQAQNALLAAFAKMSTPTPQPAGPGPGPDPAKPVQPASYNGVPMSSIPQEFTQHIPQSTMGPLEQSLLKAASKGDITSVTSLLSSGANPSAINAEGQSSLTQAISRKHNAVVRLLLEKGATTDYTGFLVHKPLHVAVSSGNIPAVEMVLDAGADIDETTAMGSVLGAACKANKTEMIDLLLKRGADVNLFSHAIYSPLLNAAMRRNEPLLKKLLRYGADPEVLHDHNDIHMRNLTDGVKKLIKDWEEGGYAEVVRNIRREASEGADMIHSSSAVEQALQQAVKKGQPEVQGILEEFGEEIAEVA